MITLILSIVGWTELARAVRGKILQLRVEDFVMAASIAGAKEFTIIVRHLLPGFMSYLIVHLTLAVPYMILGETTLSFLGIGLRPPVVSWGVMLQQAQNIRTVALNEWLLIPALFVGVHGAVLQRRRRRPARRRRPSPTPTPLDTCEIRHYDMRRLRAVGVRRSCGISSRRDIVNTNKRLFLASLVTAALLITGTAWAGGQEDGGGGAAATITVASGTYNQAPMLAAMVASGELPPVDERLPVEPMVLEVAEIGNYGGTFFVFATNNSPWNDLTEEPSRGPTLLRMGLEGKIGPDVAKGYLLAPDNMSFTLFLLRNYRVSAMTTPAPGRWEAPEGGPELVGRRAVHGA